MTPNDPIADFMALPRDRQMATLQQLSRDRQDKLLATVAQRRQKQAASMPQMSAGTSGAPRTFDPWAGHRVDEAAENVRGFLTKHAAPILATEAGLATGGLAAPAGSLIGAILGTAGAGFGGYAGAKGSGEANPGTEAAKQAAYEAGGRLAAPIIARGASPVARALLDTGAGKAAAEWAEKYPVLKELLPQAPNISEKAKVNRLTAAAGPESFDAIGKTIGDIEGEMGKLPPGKRTVQSFLDAVNAKKTVMNEEYGNAIGPIANQKTMPEAIQKRLESLITPNMDKTAAGREEKSAIKRAITEFQKPWTYGELDAERTATRARLNNFHMKGDVGQYTAKKASRNVAIDDAIEQGAKDILYPAADKAAGKPAGYTAEMKGRQASLIKLQAILDKRIEDLGGKAAQIAGSPRMSSENLSVSLHPGGPPRLGIYSIRNALVPPNPLKTASSRVAGAFPLNRLSSLPYQVLLTGAGRAEGEESKKKSVAASLSGQ